jgi:hypothetical protein
LFGLHYPSEHHSVGHCTKNRRGERKAFDASQKRRKYEQRITGKEERY